MQVDVGDGPLPARARELTDPADVARVLRLIRRKYWFAWVFQVLGMTRQAVAAEIVIGDGAARRSPARRGRVMPGGTGAAQGEQPGLEVPPWCEVQPGTGPVLLVAPHGGRRAVYDDAGPPLRRRVNDLYTPELTRRLAAALRAGRIINHGLDRNTVDLNRLSDVRRHAPTFLAHIVDAIGASLARHAAVEVVFIHGWNNGQAKCDIGIGGRDGGSGVTPVDGASLTVTPEYLATRVVRLQAACAAAGIAAPIGEKYPAGHRNNLLQAFSQRFVASDDPALRQLHDWSAAGLVNALQLELGVPLRWPGSVLRSVRASGRRRVRHTAGPRAAPAAHARGAGAPGRAWRDAAAV